jgi:hypothetical protein
VAVLRYLAAGFDRDLAELQDIPGEPYLFFHRSRTDDANRLNLDSLVLGRYRHFGDALTAQDAEGQTAASGNRKARKKSMALLATFCRLHGGPPAFVLSLRQA